IAGDVQERLIDLEDPAGLDVGDGETGGRDLERRPQPLACAEIAHRTRRDCPRSARGCIIYPLASPSAPARPARSARGCIMYPLASPSAPARPATSIRSPRLRLRLARPLPSAHLAFGS